MRQGLQIAVVLALAWPTTGCVMGVRHLAKEANRSSVQDKGRHRFPAGMPVDDARAKLIAEGFRCLDMPTDGKTKAHVSCWPTAHRTDAVEKFLVGGNWRWDLYADGTKLTKLHISSPRHGMHRQKTARGSSEDVNAAKAE
jgi:hypothetical protein